MQLVDLRLEPVLQDAVVDRVLGGQLLRIDARQLRQPTFRRRQIALHPLRAVIVEARVVAVVTEARRSLRVAVEELLDVLLCEHVEAGVIEAGMINHYYWFRLGAENGAGSMKSKLYYFGHADPGGAVHLNREVARHQRH